MEARHKAETGDYDSDDTPTTGSRCWGSRTRSATTRRASRRRRRWRRPSRTCAAGSGGAKSSWREYLAGRAAGWRGRFGAAARVVVVPGAARGARAAGGARDSDSDSDDDSDSDSDDDEKAGDGDEKGKGGKQKEGTFSSSSSDEEVGGDARRAANVDGDTKEFLKMFRLTGQSEWEERLMSLVDIDGNGNIDFKEFTVGMGILGAPPDPTWRPATRARRDASRKRRTPRSGRTRKSCASAPTRRGSPTSCSRCWTPAGAASSRATRSSP